MMQIHEAWAWLLAGLAGAALGAFFFGALWWSVQRAMGSDRSMLWHFGGLLVRMTVAVIGFYAIGAGQWQRLAACLAGFVLARTLVLRLTRSGRRVPAPTAPEVKHAPQP